MKRVSCMLICYTRQQLQRRHTRSDTTPNSATFVGIVHPRPVGCLMGQIPFSATRRPPRMSQLLRAMDHISPAWLAAYIRLCRTTASARRMSRAGSVAILVLPTFSAGGARGKDTDSGRCSTAYGCGHRDTCAQRSMSRRDDLTTRIRNEQEWSGTPDLSRLSHAYRYVEHIWGIVCAGNYRIMTTK
jgi:hypothetical protein